MADLPPLHHQRRTPSQPPIVNDRLPSIAALMATAPRESLYQHPSHDAAWPSVPPAANDGSGASSTLPAPANNKWTAINRNNTPPSSRPTSSPTYVLPAASSARRPSPPEVARHAQSTHSQHSAGDTLVTTSPHFHGSPPPSQPHFPPRQHHSGSASDSKPITQHRQDSAVSESTVSHASVASQDLAPVSSIVSESVSCSSPHSSLARHTASSALAADALSVHSSRHDRRRPSPPESPRYEIEAARTPTRPRALSDSSVSPSSQSATAAHSPPHTNGIETALRRSMAPPPNPLSAAPAAPLAGTSTSIRGHVPEPAEPIMAPRLEDDSSTRCFRCGAEWTYPPIDSSRIGQARSPDTVRAMSTSTSEVLDHMYASTLELVNHMNQYAYSRTQAYAIWQRQHQTEAGPPDSKGPPCMLPQNEAMEGTSTSTKRKFNIPIEDGHISSKLRRLSCNSPPQTLQLTPPPDQPLSSSPSHHATNHDGRYHSDHPADIEKDPHIARILGGAPRKQANGPSSTGSPDTGGMFESAGQRESLEQEKSRSASPVP